MKAGFMQPSDAALADHLYVEGVISREEWLKRHHPKAKKARKHRLGPNHLKRFLKTL